MISSVTALLLDAAGVFSPVPSKKHRVATKNFKQLQKESWFQPLFNRYGKLILFNPVIRDFLGQQDVASLKQSEKLRTHFLEKLEELLKKEKL